MSRDYGRVYGTFWSSKTTASLSDDGKLLALYLMTCTHNTIAGVFRLPDGYASEDLGWQVGRVAAGFAELEAAGFAIRCASTKWVWVCKHLEWNKPENPNQVKAAAKLALSVPDDCSWICSYLEACGPILGVEAVKTEPKINGSETVHETLMETVTQTVQELAETVPEPTKQPFRNQEQEQEQEQRDSEAKASAADSPQQSLIEPVPMSARERVWALGVPLLGDAARGLLGKLAKAHGEDAVADVLAKATLEKPIDPKTWVIAACAAAQQRKPASAVPASTAALLDRDAKPSWVIEAGFRSIYEAESAGCGQANYRTFREGRKQPA